MKIAILIGGLPRTYQKSSITFYHNIINNNSHHSIDTYLAFWDCTHQKNHNRVNKKLSNEEIANIIECYKPKKYLVMKDYDTKNYLFEERTLPLVEIIGKTTHPHGNLLIQHSVLAQSYTWYKSFELIDDDYDLIVKARFDIDYNQPIVFDEFVIDDMTVNCFGAKKQTFNMLDIIIAGSYRVMKNIMFHYHLDLMSASNIEKINKNCDIIPENILEQYIKRSGFCINRFHSNFNLITK